MQCRERLQRLCYQELLAAGERMLLDAGISDADVDSFLLLEYVTGMDRAKFFLNSRETVPAGDVQKYQELLEQRRRHIPLQHITGQQEFMGLSFCVNEHVLVPRQDTECLVELALPHVGGKRVLDLCTGSGCIAVSLMAYGSPAECHGADISMDALRVAEENARRNQTEITFVESDLFERVEGTYDVIVSNPPYIPRGEIDGLAQEVHAHEPRLALDGGEDGLDFYRRITAGSRRHLEKGGMIFYEIGCGQAEDVMGILRDAGFDEVSCRKDYAGNDRVVTGIFIDCLCRRAVCLEEREKCLTD